MRSDRIAAAILAGGAATRFGGRDKGLLNLHGRPLVAHVVAALQPQVDCLCVVANRHGDVYAAHARCVPDDTPGHAGPLAGIATALRRADADWVLTVPVDCPRPPRDLAARLRAAIGDAEAAVAFAGGERQPLFALYRRALAASAAAALAVDSPVWAWQDAIGAHKVEFDTLESFHNINTPEELAALEQGHDHG